MGDCDKVAEVIAGEYMKMFGMDDKYMKNSLKRVIRMNLGNDPEIKDAVGLMNLILDDEVKEIKKFMEEKGEGEYTLPYLYIYGKVLGLKRDEIINALEKKIGDVEELKGLEGEEFFKKMVEINTDYYSLNDIYQVMAELEEVAGLAEGGEERLEGLYEKIEE